MCLQYIAVQYRKIINGTRHYQWHEGWESQCNSPAVFKTLHRLFYLEFRKNILHLSVRTLPIQTIFFYVDKRWSEWVESMREDVECSFGILNGRWRKVRWRILKSDLDYDPFPWCCWWCKSTIWYGSIVTCRSCQFATMDIEKKETVPSQSILHWNDW